MSSHPDEQWDERSERVYTGDDTDRTAVHRADEDGPHDPTAPRHADEDRAPLTPEELQRERFGGTSIGAAFFGWLSAIGVIVLLTGIIGAVATAVGRAQDVTRTSAEQEAGTVGIVAAVVAVLVLAIGYYSGGYVAGRMARFNGVAQGRAVWILGLVVTLVAAGLGVLFGAQYDVLGRIDVPDLTLNRTQVSAGGAITAVAALVLTFLAAIGGGKVGTRFHRKIDRVA